MGIYIYYMEKNNVSPFGDKIRHLRLENGLSQTELGNKVGLSKRMIVHYEKHVKNPPPEKILAFSNALNVKVDVLINDTAKIRVSNIDPKYARKLENGIVTEHEE